MNKKYLDRYEEFRGDKGFRPVPFIKISKSNSDKTVTYDNNSRLDKISLDYYGTPFFGWLILLANPDLGSMEFEFPDNSILTIPFPLENGVNRYIEGVKKYKRLNG
tara:strand:+ start:233 stop:550 length:318 start_codon:yes stop_codon:yes gene_type:complete